MSNEEKTKGAASYLFGPVTGLYFLLTEKKNNFIRFHAMQSTLVFSFIILFEIILELIPIFGKFLIYLYPTVNSLIFILWLVLLWKAWNGEKYKVRFFGDLAEKHLNHV